MHKRLAEVYRIYLKGLFGNLQQIFSNLAQSNFFALGFPKSLKLSNWNVKYNFNLSYNKGMRKYAKKEYVYQIRSKCKF